jgi:hypothetical protein
MCEAVRIAPVKPTAEEIAAAGGKGRQPRPTGLEPAHQKLVAKVCEAIEEAATAAAVDEAIAPHRELLLQMDDRLRTIVSSAKKARLATLGAATKGDAHAE